MTATVAPPPSVVTRPEFGVPERCWTFVPPPVREPTAAELVRQALDALPEMPWAVARYLGDRDYLGRPRRMHDCPVNRYLATALFRAGFETDRLGVGRRSVRGVGARVRLPEGVRSFVREFDRGWYPLLVGGP
jgi:hypothetical protein